MVVRRKRKTQKLRGTTTHGCGSMKKRRGAGNRGGRGRAGTGYRGDAKKPSVWKVRVGGKDPEKRGFHSRFNVDNTINVGHLASIAQTLVTLNQATETQGAIVINLREMGIEKLLGAGRVTLKLKVGVHIASPKAKAKIEAAGGSLDADIIADKEGVLVARAAKKLEQKGKKKKEEPSEEPKEAVEEVAA